MTLVRKGQGSRRIIPADTAGQLIEVPIPQQIDLYLSRLRYTVPFPCTKEDAYFGLVPRAIESWYRAGVFEAKTLRVGRESNLLNTMFSTFDKQRLTRDVVASSNILHVSVESDAEYIESLKGNRGCEKVFWFVAPPHVPLPRNSQMIPFFLAEDHPHYDTLVEWFKEATIIENEIVEAAQIVNRYASVISTRSQIQHTWPELLSFCRFKNRVTHCDDAHLPLQERVAAVIDKQDIETVNTLLATAVLLPEKQPMLQSWVTFYNTGISKP